MNRYDIKSETGTKLVTSLNVFSYWIINQSKTFLYGQNNIHCSPEVMSKTIGIVCVILEMEKFISS